MTNVLIGIIGVILFIGLAIAGAMFLGPQFQRAQNNSRAMAVTQAASQISQAANLQRTVAGSSVFAGTPASTLQSAGYLRVLPVNPYVDRGGRPYRVLSAQDLESHTLFADIVLVNMGATDEAQEVCKAINRQSAGTDVIQELALHQGANVSPMVSSPVGCFRMHDVGIPAEANPHDYIVYSHL